MDSGTSQRPGSGGYALVPRDVLALPVFRNEAESLLFVGMILRASWRDQTVRYKGHVLRLQRGQLAVSIRDLARAMDRDKAWVERLWKRLKSEAMIETQTEAGVSVVTICNYDEYQQPQRHCQTASETPGEAEHETGARQARDTEQSSETIETSEPIQIGALVGRAKRADPFPRPEWADPQAWADFLVNRKAKRCPNTATAYAAFLRDIERLASPQWPPERLLAHATARGWAGIYEPREANDHVRGSMQSSSIAPIEFGPDLTIERLRRERVSP